MALGVVRPTTHSCVLQIHRFQTRPAWTNGRAPHPSGHRTACEADPRSTTRLSRVAQGMSIPPQSKAVQASGGGKMASARSYSKMADIDREIHMDVRAAKPILLNGCIVESRHHCPVNPCPTPATPSHSATSLLQPPDNVAAFPPEMCEEGARLEDPSSDHRLDDPTVSRKLRPRYGPIHSGA